MQEHEENAVFKRLGVTPKRCLTPKSWLLLSNFYVNLVIFVRDPLVSVIKNTDFNHEIFEEQLAFGFLFVL